MVKKHLIDKASIIEDMVSNIVPKYLQIAPSDSLNSAFGIITMNQAVSIDDTYKLAVARSADAILEISDSLPKLRMAAAIYNVATNRVTPANTMCTLHINVDDILEKGIKSPNGDILFKIDSRSDIIHDETPFSLQDNIIIRAVKSVSNGFFYTVEYESLDPSINPISIQTVTLEGIQKLQLTMIVYQYRINSTQKSILDLLEFATEGLLFEYENYMAGFDVYYKQSSATSFTKVNMVYHVIDTMDNKSLRFNDDKDSELYILSNYNLELQEDTILRVDIKESLGLDGMIDLGQRTTEFTLYQDDDYNLLSVEITAILLLDPSNGKSQDSAADIRKRLIQRKFSRESLITEMDVTSFINREFENTQLVPRKNDFKSTEHSLYTLLKINGVVAPTTTMNLKIFQDEFDVYHNISDRRILKSNAAFVVTDSSKSLTRRLPQIPTADAMKALEEDRNQLCLNFPFVLAVTPEPLCKIFMNTIDNTMSLQSGYQNENSILKYAVRDVSFQRNSMSTNYDKYFIKATLMPNSIDDTGLLNEDGTINHEQLKPFIIFNSKGFKKAYTQLTISSIDKEKNLIFLTGEFRTDDFITEDSQLKITHGMKLLGEATDSELVIDYLDSKFEIVLFNKHLPLTTSSEYYTMIPGMTEYQVTNTSVNKDGELNLLIDLNAFMNCTIKVIEEEGRIGYIISEMPFIKYSYCKANNFNILTQINKLKLLYSELSAKLVGKTINLKFIRTYGKSKYIKIGKAGFDLGNINPVFKFSIYGNIANFQDITDYAMSYFDTVNDLDKGKIYMSNVCREIELRFAIDSCVATGIDTFTEVNPVIVYEKPDKEVTPELYATYIPEYLCIGNIVINNEQID